MDQYISQAFSWINGILYSSTYRFNTMLAFIDYFPYLHLHVKPFMNLFPKESIPKFNRSKLHKKLWKAGINSDTSDQQFVASFISNSPDNETNKR